MSNLGILPRFDNKKLNGALLLGNEISWWTWI